eukprot:SAG11_NODE_6394_length_1322_cov_1.587899_2_plen_92_part_00
MEDTNVPFLLLVLFGCALSRGVNIFGLSAVLNCGKADDAKILSCKEQTLLWFSEFHPKSSSLRNIKLMCVGIVVEGKGLFINECSNCSPLA